MTDEREESAGKSDPAEPAETAERDPEAVDVEEGGAGDPTPTAAEAAAGGSDPDGGDATDSRDESRVEGGSESGGGAGSADRPTPDEQGTVAEEGSGATGETDAATGDAGAPTGGTDAEPTADATATATGAGDQPEYGPGVPEDVRTYDRFTKIDGSTYDRANDFLRERTYITAREWAIARLCADFRTETGVEMTKIGEHLPELVPFMTDTYSPQAVNQARAAFEEKVRKAGATFLYGAMSDFFTAEELDDVMYESTEVAKFLLEVEGVDLTVEEELEAEDKISEVMREVREHSAALRHDEVVCPECGHHIEAEDA